MIQSIVEHLNLLHGVYFYPEIAVGCGLVYFIVRQRWDKSGKWSIFVPLPLSLLGMLAFSWPTSKQGWSLAMFMACLQWSFGIAAYSIADKYGWMNKFGKKIARKISGDGVAK